LSLGTKVALDLFLPRTIVLLKAVDFTAIPEAY